MNENSKNLQIILSQASFAPGELVRGAIKWHTSTSPKRVTVQIGWYTEGRGSTDSRVEYEQAWDTEELTGTEAFEFELPLTPYSFAGKLIELKWYVKLQTRKGGHMTHTDFVFAPARERVTL